MAQYHGKNGVVYMSASAATAAVPFLYQTEWTLNSAAATDDVTHFGNINMRYVMGIPDCVVELSGFWDDTYDAPWDNARSATGVNVYLYPNSGVPTKYWYGPAWFSFNEISVPVGGAISISGTASANGDWGQY